MTIILPELYHAKSALESNNITCISASDAAMQDIRPLRIGILNIMSNIQTYEFNLLYPLSKSILQIIPVWLRLQQAQKKVLLDVTVRDLLDEELKTRHFGYQDPA